VDGLSKVSKVNWAGIYCGGWHKKSNLVKGRILNLFGEVNISVMESRMKGIKRPSLTFI